MQKEIIQYFKEGEMIPLSESNFTWEEAHEKVPRLTKGWFELSKLEPTIRLEFTRDYWFNALPFDPHVHAFIDRFFGGVSEVGMVAAIPKHIQEPGICESQRPRFSSTEAVPYPRDRGDAEGVKDGDAGAGKNRSLDEFGYKGAIYLSYSLKERSEFFLGGPPLVDEEISNMGEQIDFPLPEDFLQFFRVHNGFFKGGDTGIFSSGVLVEERERFRTLETPLILGGEAVPGEALFPFYRSFDSAVYQCFYKEWYPDGAAGNVLCSLGEGTISDYRTSQQGSLAFRTFLDWLAFYVEGI
ncbi:hypothetical protein [Candidatus Neptunochlamydia vexilliferae]|uniref:hypothetical protein n=1 Tax=Candidatus Neptunichlamydia vexilliferae TaxID=1651774 RepID=UPI001891CC7A|nr:hypothetical protein [Candidatus Neptunochlamydia vexilliferae]